MITVVVTSFGYDKLQYKMARPSTVAGTRRGDGEQEGQAKPSSRIAVRRPTNISASIEGLATL